MPNPVIGMIGASVGGSAMAAKAQKSAANKASDAQVQAAQIGVDEQKRQFDIMRTLMQPFVDAGGGALAGQMNLIGLNGNEAQGTAINDIANSAEMAALTQQGENAMLQNASATGGLRGGNTQGALAQFRPQLLNQLVNQRFGQLGGLTQMGQASAAGVGAGAMQMGQNVSDLYQQQGAARAGNFLAQGQATSNMVSGIAGSVGNVLGGIQPPAGATLFGKWGF